MSSAEIERFLTAESDQSYASDETHFLESKFKLKSGAAQLKAQRALLNAKRRTEFAGPAVDFDFSDHFSDQYDQSINNINNNINSNSPHGLNTNNSSHINTHSQPHNTHSNPGNNTHSNPGNNTHSNPGSNTHSHSGIDPGIPLLARLRGWLLERLKVIKILSAEIQRHMAARTGDWNLVLQNL
jgi:hypothetical protein